MKGGQKYNAFWACDEQAICPRCGAEFRKFYVAQKYCGCKPTKLEITLEQSVILQHFKNLCTKHNLNLFVIFKMLTYSGKWEFYRLTNIKLQAHLSPERRRLWCKLIERFCGDFENGWYDLEKKPRWKKYVVRKRKEPKQRTCPKNLSHCRGAIWPGTCPRQWKDCSLSEGYAAGLRCA